MTDDVLEMIRDIPACLGDTTIATELKYITLGAVLSKCAEEIVWLREENMRLRNGKGKNTRTPLSDKSSAGRSAQNKRK